MSEQSTQGEESPPEVLWNTRTGYATKYDRVDVPPDIRASIGARAKARRKELGLSRVAITEPLGITEASLLRWEKEGVPASMREDWLAGWERALQVAPGWLLGRASSLNGAPPVDNVVSVQSGTFTDAIYEVARRLARRGRSVHASDRPLSDAEARNADLFAARYGVLGSEESTLEAVALPFGLTRERVRQVVQVMVEKSQLFSYDIAAVDELAQACLPHLPVPTPVLTERVRTYLGPKLTIDDANRFAVEVLGRQIVRISAPVNSGPSPRVESIAFDPAQSTEASDDIKELRSVAYQMIRASGAAHMSTVAGEAILSGRVSKEAKVQLLMSVAGFEWLDDDESWFWFGPARPGQNTFVNNMRKVFSVATEAIDATELVAALMRARSKTAHRDFDRPRSLMLIPPMHVARAVLERLDFLSVIQYDDFRAAVSLNPQEELSETEMAVYEVMKELDGVASRTEIRERLIDTGRFLAVTVSLVVDGSPFLTRIGRGVYGLVGWPLLAPALTRAIGSVGGPGARGADVVRHENGSVSFPFFLSEFAVRGKVCVLPAAAVSLVPAGSYRLHGTEQVIDCSHRASGASSLNRLVQALLSMGYKAGDQVLIRLDPAAMSLTVTSADGNA